STLGMKVTPDSDSPSLKNLRPRTKRRHCRQGTGGERIASRRGSEPVQEQNRRMDALVRPQSKDGRGRPSYKSRCSSWTGSTESSAGDQDAAQRRLEFLTPFPRLDITDEVEPLAAKLIADVPLPPKAQADALHIAVAAVNIMNYLLTWNCTHIANATLRFQIET